MLNFSEFIVSDLNCPILLNILFFCYIKTQFRKQTLSFFTLGDTHLNLFPWNKTKVGSSFFVHFLMMTKNVLIFRERKYPDMFGSIVHEFLHTIWVRYVQMVKIQSRYTYYVYLIKGIHLSCVETFLTPVFFPRHF